VFYLFLNRKANSFTHDFIRAISKKIDEVEKNDGPTAMVTISLSKLFSGGLDLRYATNLPHESQGWFVLEFISLLGRISVLPFPTLAIVKGGAVAGGCMFSFAHDYIHVADKALFACN
jgi:enoyl-CoA hydratase/carnithine racemase